MTDNELNKITSKFDDVKPLIEENRVALKTLNSTRKRLRTKRNYYGFIKIVVGLNSAGDKLVDACVDLFKEIGFDKIENVDKKYLEEDIRLWDNDRLIIIEVTGIDTPNPKQDKAHQISKHIKIRQSQYKNKRVTGLFIANHDNNKEYKNRNKKPFDEKIIEIAKSHDYTLMSTVDLLNAYKMIKMGIIKPEEFIAKLCSTGLFEL
jgi:hypothetical protein